MEGKLKEIEIIQSAEQIYRTSTVDNVWKKAKDYGIKLLEGELIENDSPAAGESRLAPGIYEAITDRIFAKKELWIEDLRASSALLLFLGKEEKGNKTPLYIDVNGNTVVRKASLIGYPLAKQYQLEWGRWYYVDLPLSYLREGKNEIVFRTPSKEPSWYILVANDEEYYKGTVEDVKPPNTSAKSRDGGKTWNYDRLGSEDAFDGEYIVRIYLKKFRRKGSITSSIIDVGSAPEGSIVKHRVDVKEITITLDLDLPPKTYATLEVRTGKTPFYDEASWSRWIKLGSGEKKVYKLDGEILNRYLQWKVTLTTDDPLTTPTLKSIKIRSKVIQYDWPEGFLKVVDYKNPELKRSSWNFDYEKWNHPRLQELRRKFKLDSVVEGCKTEFEKILRLLNWAYRIPIGEVCYYPWDALRMLKLEYDSKGEIKLNVYDQRRRDKMCLFPAIVFMQACLSFGIQARHININSEGLSGHEVVEVWSNDYEKWIYMDPTRDFYYYDKNTGIPLNALEIHNILVERLKEVEDWRRPFYFTHNISELTKNLPIGVREGENRFPVTEYALKSQFLIFQHLRIIPRNNFLSRHRPLPVNQGDVVWCWDGYLNWADEKTPPLPHFSKHTNRPQDMYWSINQVSFVLEMEEEPGSIRVYLETITPDFSGFLVNIDGSGWTERDKTFIWRLHEGINHMAVRSETTSGLKNPVSWIKIVYHK